jgi:hypothetical protein
MWQQQIPQHHTKGREAKELFGTSNEYRERTAKSSKRELQF